MVSLNVIFLQLRITSVESLSRETVFVALIDVGKPTPDTDGTFC